MILGGCISKSKDCLQPSTLFFNSPWCERMKEKFFFANWMKNNLYAFFTSLLCVMHFIFHANFIFRTYLIKMHFSSVQFFYVGPFEEDIFLTTFYGLYFNQQAHIFYRLQFFVGPLRAASMYCFNSSVLWLVVGNPLCCTTLFSCALYPHIAMSITSRIW